MAFKKAELSDELIVRMVEMDGKPAGKIESSGVDLINLAPGPHELVVTAQGITHRLSFNAGPAPAMTV